MTTPIWPCIIYRDAPAAIEFLTKAFGFDATLVVPENPTDVVEHAELRMANGAGVMLGSVGRGSPPFDEMPVGGSSVYVVVDDPEPIHDAAVAAGAEIVRGLRHEDYGSYGFSARDPEGNVWSFGTYAGT